jgi:lysozyme family protein
LAANGFIRCIPEILHQEGGYSNNKKDSGGATNLGVTQGELAVWCKRTGRTVFDVRNLTLELAKEIYRADYWNAAGCEQIPEGLDLAVFDCAVNNGVRRAVEFLHDVSTGKNANLSTAERIVAFDRLRVDERAIRVEI